MSGDEEEEEPSPPLGFNSGSANVQCYVPSSETWQNSVAHSTIQVLGGLMKSRQELLPPNGDSDRADVAIFMYPFSWWECYRLSLNNADASRHKSGLFLSAESCSLNLHSARRLCSCVHEHSVALFGVEPEGPEDEEAACLTGVLVACLAAAEEKNQVCVAQPLLSRLLHQPANGSTHTKYILASIVASLSMECILALNKSWVSTIY